MSHIVTIRTQVKDLAAVRAACQRLHLRPPVEGSAQLFGGSVSGTLVQFEDWRYPLVLNLECAEVRYDNYDGAWGDPAKLDRFLQAYAVEKTRLEARRKGMDVVEQPLPCGSVRLQLSAPA